MIDSLLYIDIATRLGISVTGNDARFDSDAGLSTPTTSAPTNRLSRILNDIQNEDSNDSIQSTDSVQSSDSVHRESSRRSGRLRSNVNRLQGMSIQNSAESLNESGTSIRNEPSTSAVSLSNTSTNVTRNFVFPRSTTQTSTQASAPNVGNSDSHAIPTTAMTLTTSTPRRQPIQPIQQIQPLQRNQQNIRDVQLNSSIQLNEYLVKQNANMDMQTQYLQNQIDRSKTAGDREKVLLQVAEVELERAKELAKIEVDKQRELAKIVIEGTKRQYPN